MKESFEVWVWRSSDYADATKGEYIVWKRLIECGYWNMYGKFAEQGG